MNKHNCIIAVLIILILSYFTYFKFESFSNQCVLVDKDTICKRKVTATRMDQNSGWDLPLKFKCEEVEVNIGGSPSKSKESISEYNLKKGDCPVVVNKSNWIKQNYHDNACDYFSIEVSDCISPSILSTKVCNRKVTATRKDKNDGWELPLKFKCGEVEVDIGDSKTNSKESEYNLNQTDCPKEVNRNNRIIESNSDNYWDQFEITVSDCNEDVDNNSQNIESSRQKVQFNIRIEKTTHDMIGYIFPYDETRSIVIAQWNQNGVNDDEKEFIMIMYDGTPQNLTRTLFSSLSGPPIPMLPYIIKQCDDNDNCESEIENLTEDDVKTLWEDSHNGKGRALYNVEVSELNYIGNS